MVSKEEFRSAVAYFATGVTLVTTVNANGQPHAMTANSFTSVCLDPPTVLVCVAHKTQTHGFLQRTGRFGVNILRQDQEDLGAHFAKPAEERKEEVKYSYTCAEDGVPCLDHSMVFLGCRVIGSHVYGDHTVYIGQVEEIRKNEADTPLMFFRSRWYDPANE